MIWSHRKKDRISGPGILTVLDVGSSKTCCIIARLNPCSDNFSLRSRTHKIQVIGIGYQKSLGIKSGVIIDPDRAEKAIRLCVDSAERMAGVTVDSLIVSLTAGRLKSTLCSGTLKLGGREVRLTDIENVLIEGMRQSMKTQRQIVHSLPLSFSLDSLKDVRSPCGMVGDVLGVDMHVLTADPTPQRNLELVINRSHLVVDCMVATPYASGLATLVDDELEMGAACIDMGAGTTSVSIFNHGKFLFADSIALGGNHVTFDLAQGLSIGFEDAERLKVMHASVIPCSPDDFEMLTLKPISGQGTETPMQVPRRVVTRIARARIEEILEMLRDRLMRSGYCNIVGKRLVLTGGGSQMVGMSEAVRRIFGRNVRIGRPLGIAGLPETAKNPAFSGVVGLIIYPQMVDCERQFYHSSSSLKMTGTEGPFYRMSQWIRKKL